MDNENETSDAVTHGLPKTSGFPAPTATTSPGTALEPTPDARSTVAVASEGQDRNGIFRHLVSNDQDITGLVAYSIYKQNKLDWLGAFDAAKGRAPSDGELSAYIIGEGTPRRLATYRHLAEATLAGQGPDVDGGSRTGLRRGASPVSAVSPSLIALYVGIAILFGIGFWLATRFTMASH